MPDSSTDAPRRSRRKEARPGELLEAALSLFLEKGYAATRVEAVAARAGVSKGTLFLYFPSKEELFKAVVRHSISGCYANWQLELDRYQGSSAALLARAFEVWWQQIASTQAGGICRLMWAEAAHFPELAAFYRHEVDEPGHAMLERILQRGMDSGEFRPMPLGEALYLVLTPMTFVMLWQPTGTLCLPMDHGLTPHSYLLSQFRNCLRGLLREPVDADTLPLPQLHPTLPLHTTDI